MAASSTDDDFVAEINVTPFVDVMLVLLVIFMVTAPMMTEGLEVALPKVESSEVLPGDNDHAILTVKSEGTIFIDEFETGMDELVAIVREHVKGQGKQLFVRADQNVPYGTVMNVMDRLRGAGIEDVSLVTTSAFDDATEASVEPNASATDGSQAVPGAENVQPPAQGDAHGAVPAPALAEGADMAG